MDIKNLTVGDIKAWALKILHEELEAVINSKSRYSLPYYILVIMKEGYVGPPAYGNSNELLHGGKKQNGEKEVDLSGKRVMTHRFVLLSNPPIIPLIGSALIYVNNKTGQVKFKYILPPDRPMIGGFDVELESSVIAKCEKYVPIAYGSKN